MNAPDRSRRFSFSYFCDTPTLGSKAFIVRTNGDYSLGNWVSSKKYLEKLLPDGASKNLYAGKRLYPVWFEIKSMRNVKPYGGKAIPESLIQWVDESFFKKLEQKILSEYENMGKQFSANEVIPGKIMRQALQALAIQSETLTSTLSDA